MHDILHNLFIEAKPLEVFKMISTSKGLNRWWTMDSEGAPKMGETYKFYFGPEYTWKGKITKIEPSMIIEWEMTECDADWNDTLVGFSLQAENNGTRVEFYHKEWKSNNLHFRRSSYCWALYLRLLKRYIEHDEFIPYGHRNNA